MKCCDFTLSNRYIADQSVVMHSIQPLACVISIFYAEMLSQRNVNGPNNASFMLECCRIRIGTGGPLALMVVFSSLRQSQVQRYDVAVDLQVVRTKHGPQANLKGRVCKKVLLL